MMKSVSMVAWNVSDARRCVRVSLTLASGSRVLSLITMIYWPTAGFLRFD
jgi:hypothetical protein